MLSDLDFAVAYLDDILMNSQNVEQHQENVHEDFSRIQEYSFKLKESKCDFFMKKIIDKDGRRPDPERATAVRHAISRKGLFFTKFLWTDKLLPSVYT